MKRPKSLSTVRREASTSGTAPMLRRVILRAALPGVFLLSVACGAQAPDPEPQVSEASPYEASGEERAEIIATLQRLFDALGTGDGDALRDLLDPQVQMNSVERDADGNATVGTSTVEQLVQRVEAEGPPLIERMFDPEVRISGDLATIWTPYDFYVGSDFSHCGADAVTLRRDGGGWKVIALNWTRLQPPACPLHPDGPPNGA